MFVAWLITISLFFICIYSTVVIINGVKQKDKYDLAQLQTQLTKAPKKGREELKQAM